MDVERLSMCPTMSNLHTSRQEAVIRAKAWVYYVHLLSILRRTETDVTRDKFDSVSSVCRSTVEIRSIGAIKVGLLEASQLLVKRFELTPYCFFAVDVYAPALRSRSNALRTWL